MEIPPIISINVNVDDFDDLKNNLGFINKYFKLTIEIYNNIYKLIGFITQPFRNHFISYFQDFNEDSKECLNSWYKYDDFVS